MVKKSSVAVLVESKPCGDMKVIGTLTENTAPYRKDSEDSLHKFGVSNNTCGSSDVLCYTGDILSNIFPCLSNYDNDDSNSMAEKKGLNVVARSPDLTPSTTPIRRGRFLVWPAVLDCDGGLPTCAAVPITSSSTSSE